MWIQIDADHLQRWKSPHVESWIDVSDNNTAQVDKETGEKLIAEYNEVSEYNG